MTCGLRFRRTGEGAVERGLRSDVTEMQPGNQLEAGLEALGCLDFP